MTKSLLKAMAQAKAHGFQKSKPGPQALESHAKSPAWPGFSQLALFANSVDFIL
jgi:hypothetical protein